MEGKTSAAIIGEFGITCQIDQSNKENSKEYQINLVLYRLKKKLLEENLITSLEDKLILIDPTDAKEIRESHLDKAPENFFVFNKKLCSKDSVERIYEEQIFKIKKLTLEGNWIFLTNFFGIDLKENQSIEEVISNQWNFKPLLSLSEDIDF